MTHYRIVTVWEGGYVIQRWRWWWPFWSLIDEDGIGYINRFDTPQQARQWVDRRYAKTYFRSEIVERFTYQRRPYG